MATQHDTSCDVTQVSSELRQVLRLPGGGQERGPLSKSFSVLTERPWTPSPPRDCLEKGAGPCYKAEWDLVRREEEAAGWQPPLAANRFHVSGGLDDAELGQVAELHVAKRLPGADDRRVCRKGEVRGGY